LFKTKETVVVETPAFLATSLMVVWDAIFYPLAKKIIKGNHLQPFPGFRE
jgi:hypothetical protein